jgi:hypothetical protein
VQPLREREKGKKKKHGRFLKAQNTRSGEISFGQQHQQVFTTQDCLHDITHAISFLVFSFLISFLILFYLFQFMVVRIGEAGNDTADSSQVIIKGLK